MGPTIGHQAQGTSDQLKQGGKRQQLSNNSTRRGAQTQKSSLYWTQCLDQTQSRVISYSVTKVQILCCGGKQMRQGFPLWLFYQSLIYVYFPHQHLSSISSPQVDNVSLERFSEQVDMFDIVIHSNIHLCQQTMYHDFTALLFSLMLDQRPLFTFTFMGQGELVWNDTSQDFHN